MQNKENNNGIFDECYFLDNDSTCIITENTTRFRPGLIDSPKKSAEIRVHYIVAGKERPQHSMRAKVYLYKSNKDTPCPITYIGDYIEISNPKGDVPLDTLRAVGALSLFARQEVEDAFYRGIDNIRGIGPRFDRLPVEVKQQYVSRVIIKNI